MSGIVSGIPIDYNVFEPRFDSNVVLSTFLETFNPTSTINDINAPIVFSVPGNPYWVDLKNSYILLQCEYIGEMKTGDTVVNIDNTGVKIGPINNLGHSLFNKISLSLNTKEVASVSNYAYVSYLSTLLNHEKNSLETFMGLSGWLKDEVGKIDDVDSTADGVLKKRRAMAHDRKTIDFIIKPDITFFNSEKNIIPHCDIDLKLERNPKADFLLMYHTVAATTYNFHIQIKNASFHVRRMETVPDLTIGLDMMLTKNKIPITYAVQCTQVIPVHVSTGQSLFTLNNIFQGNVPQRIIVVFVSNEAYNGSPKKNPFNFEHCGITSINLTKNGISYPHPIINADFSHAKYNEAYYHTMKSLQAPNGLGPDISMNEYGNGFTFMSYDLTTDQCGGAEKHKENTKANIHLAVTFNPPLTEEKICLVFYEQQINVSIDYKRHVLVETVY